jgi:maltose O-acetyltransferase
MLDVAPVRIGAASQLAPRGQLLTATHPIDPEPRRLGWESAEPIAIGGNRWLGGGAIVCPGMTIGDDTVVGAGAVVTRDLPAGVLAAGVPARVLREIDERDRVAIPDVPRA